MFNSMNMVVRNGRGCARPVGGAHADMSNEMDDDNDIIVKHEGGQAGNSNEASGAKCYEDISFQDVDCMVSTVSVVQNQVCKVF